MLTQIIEKEHRFNALLPAGLLEDTPSADLLAAAAAWSRAVWVEAERLGAIPLNAEQISQGLALAQHPVFICGVHRSGTTLARDLLDAHPSLVVLPSEGTFYTNLESKLAALPENERMAFLGMEWLRRLANPINQPPYWLLGRSNNAASPYVLFARYVQAWWNILCSKENTQWPHAAIILAYACCTGYAGAKLWVDKTPVNERYLQRIWQEMPNARIIHIIRHPAAILASRRKMEPSVTLRSTLRDMQTSFNVALQQSHAGNPQYLLVRYEELCAQPNVVIKKIAAFLGIEENEILYKPTVAGIPSISNSSFNRNVQRQIHSATPGERENILTPGEKNALAACIGTLAAKLNYPLPAAGFFSKLYARLKYRLL